MMYVIQNRYGEYLVRQERATSLGARADLRGPPDTWEPDLDHAVRFPSEAAAVYAAHGERVLSLERAWAESTPVLGNPTR